MLLEVQMHTVDVHELVVAGEREQWLLELAQEGLEQHSMQVDVVELGKVHGLTWKKG